MKKILALPAVLLVTVVALTAGPAIAGSVTPVAGHFIEPVHPDVNSGCLALALPDGGFCGTGVLLPYGHGTETIAFGPGCGGGCDLRTVDLPSGSIVMEEAFSHPGCPGSCEPNPAEPASGTLTDVITSGTGIFKSATGVLTGRVSAAGPQSRIELSGTITFAP